MINLQEMTVTEAMRAAKKASGKTIKEIAHSLGISPGVIARYLKEDDDYSPRMGMIPDLCRVLENDIILQWLEVRIREDRERRKEKMLLHMAKMERTLKNVEGLLASKEEITAEDGEELHDLLDTMKRECQRLGGLLPSAPYQYAPGEKGTSEAEGTRRQALHDHKG